MKKKKLIKIFIIVDIILIIIAGAIVLSSGVGKDKGNTVTDTQENENHETQVIETDKYGEYVELWQSNKSINDDYLGNIRFESGIIDQPFVISKDNDDYLRRDFETKKYSVLGTVFMDYECDLDSQNIILYGHNAFSSYDAGTDENGNKIDNKTLMFTPLDQFKDKENYEKNKTVYLILEDEIRTYEVAAAYYCKLIEEDGYLLPQEDMYYYLPYYGNDYFDTYKEAVTREQFYSTGVDYSNKDKFLTLQTCVEGNDNLRLIVLCKYISSEFYSG